MYMICNGNNVQYYFVHHNVLCIIRSAPGIIKLCLYIQMEGEWR